MAFLLRSGRGRLRSHRPQPTDRGPGAGEDDLHRPFSAPAITSSPSTDSRRDRWSSKEMARRAFGRFRADALMATRGTSSPSPTPRARPTPRILGCGVPRLARPRSHPDPGDAVLTRRHRALQHVPCPRRAAPTTSSSLTPRLPGTGGADRRAQARGRPSGYGGQHLGARTTPSPPTCSTPPRSPRWFAPTG